MRRNNLFVMLVIILFCIVAPVFAQEEVQLVEVTPEQIEKLRAYSPDDDITFAYLLVLNDLMPQTGNVMLYVKIANNEVVEKYLTDFCADYPDVNIIKSPEDLIAEDYDQRAAAWAEIEDRVARILILLELHPQYRQITINCLDYSEYIPFLLEFSVSVMDARARFSDVTGFSLNYKVDIGDVKMQKQLKKW